ALRRLHQRINALLEEPLPDADEEAADPATADRRYDEAVVMLRERTRDTRRFRLVFAENMEYGFRRNSLGLRPVALLTALLGLGVSVTLVFVGHGDEAERAVRWSLPAVISAGACAYWWCIVTPDWVF